MQDIAARWRGWAPWLLCLLRLVTAFLFIQFGTAKLFAFPGPLTPGGGAVPMGSLYGIAGLIEVVTGSLLLLGLFSRPAAFIAAGEMAVAYFHSHAPHGFWPVLNGGHPAVLFCFIWLYISSAGPGAWSLDALRKRA